MLRKILSEYLKVEPRRLRFSYGEEGKPHLVGGFCESGLQFNLAHSHELALYACTLVRRIGVDLEYIRPLPDIDQISTRFFSAFESTTLGRLWQSKKLQAFYNCWTRKEAYLKATGEGLSRPLASFDVSLTPGEPAKLLFVQDDKRETMRWSFWSSTLDCRYVAAVCIEGHDWRLKTWERLCG
jgi:4'-phosphopantetheinyl transferase